MGEQISSGSRGFVSPAYVAKLWELPIADRLSKPCSGALRRRSQEFSGGAFSRSQEEFSGALRKSSQELPGGALRSSQEELSGALKAKSQELSGRASRSSGKFQ